MKYSAEVTRYAPSPNALANCAPASRRPTPAGGISLLPIPAPRPSPPPGRK
ncbi:hypothetical protein GCM10023235_18760 [Kitasatospora terrestris]|uniref:Uncharacterized protein n=1 Tax=Kitasatospora terrestris TaxID=258051 RepID=A0ABP9DLZ8_9ACTN